MINLGNMKRQHKAITEEINNIELALRTKMDNLDTAKIALHINRLAGQLKIHLIEEDKYLYPNLLDSGIKEIEILAKEYNEEMGDLSQSFSNYKNAYNVSSKINNNKGVFLEDTREALKALKHRINKEDSQLYCVIESQKL